MFYSMRKIRLFVIVFSSLAAAECWGNDVRNGGNVIVCQDYTRLLDYYEGEAVWGFHTNHQTLSTEARGYDLHAAMSQAEILLGRISALDPQRYFSALRALRKMQESAAILPGIILPPVQDTGPIFQIPTGCKLTQAASQGLPRFPNEFYFVFSEDIWNAMADVDRVGLVLHEALYFYEIQTGQVTSRSARYLTALVSSSEVGEYSQAGYSDSLRKGSIVELSGLSEKIAELFAAIFHDFVGKIFSMDGQSSILFRDLVVSSDIIVVYLTEVSPQRQTNFQLSVQESGDHFDLTAVAEAPGQLPAYGSGVLHYIDGVLYWKLKPLSDPHGLLSGIAERQFPAELHPN